MATNSFFSRASLYNLIGKLFGGNRDLYKVFGYDKDLNYKKMVVRYRRQDIASRIVDAPADALWANPPKLTSPDETWNKAWNDLVINGRIFSAIHRADRMAAMGDYSILLFGFNNTSKLNTPAGKEANRKVLYLQPYSYSAAEIKSLVQNAADPRYLKPEIYQIKPGMDPLENTNPKGITSAFKSIQTFDAHYSRVLHIGENYLQDEVFGMPRMERVYNLLDDVLKVAGGTSETFWLAGNRGMHIDIDKEMELTADDESDLSEEIEEYVHQLRRVIRTRGVKINNLGSDVPDPANAFSMLLSLISGATGIPKRILLGSEAGQLASTEDRNNWAERIEERRKNFAEPVILYPTVRLLTSAGALPDSEFSIEWPDAFKLSPLERAQTSAQKARSASNLAKAIDTNSQLITIDEAREILEIRVTPTATNPKE